MKKLLKIKNVLFLTAIWLSSGSFVHALVNKKMDEQSQALADTAGLGGSSDLAGIFSVLIQVFLGFLGIIFLFLTLQSGFKWMTAAGNEKQIEDAKSSLKSSIIGLFIVLAAYAITLAVFRYMPFSTGSTVDFSGGPTA